MPCLYAFVDHNKLYPYLYFRFYFLCTVIRMKIIWSQLRSYSTTWSQHSCLVTNDKNKIQDCKWFCAEIIFSRWVNWYAILFYCTMSWPSARFKVFFLLNIARCLFKVMQYYSLQRMLKNIMIKISIIRILSRQSFISNRVKVDVVHISFQNLQKLI